MRNNFSNDILFKIDLFNKILNRYSTTLFSDFELIKFDSSIFSENFCDFYLIKNNDSIHFSITDNDIIIDIGVFDECLMFDNSELEKNATIAIIESIFKGYINLTILENNSKILSIYNSLGIEIYTISRKDSFFWGSTKVKKSKIFLPL
jgi:hypothetical protein